MDNLPRLSNCATRNGHATNDVCYAVSLSDEELLMACMKDLIPANRLAGTFGTATALLAPFTDCLTLNAVDVLAVWVM